MLCSPQLPDKQPSANLPPYHNSKVMGSRSLFRPRLGLLQKLNEPLPRVVYLNSNPRFRSCCATKPRNITGLRLVHTSKLKKREVEKRLQNPSPRRADNSEHLEELLRDALKMLESTEAPQEAAVLQSLSTCEEVAKQLQGVADVASPSKSKDSPAMKLLFLDSNTGPHTISQPRGTTDTSTVEEAKERVSAAALNIVLDPKVFITPKILKVYVDVQSLLDKPQAFPKVFDMYALKAIPTPGTSPVSFTPAKEASMTSAIPLGTTKIALGTAIRSQDLSLCLDIITSTVCTPAFRRAKLFQRALAPISGFALAPVAAYTVASQLSLFQNTMSDEVATKIAFAGILTYLGCTATLGIVAVTTSNDQMERVTWAQGTPLRERWLREEERAMLDRVASAWGFKETWRRGEEEGSDWEALRELVGIRGMVLDRTDLMEGME